MANSLLTISMITREAIELFVNSNAFLKHVDRQYDKEFGIEGKKIGSQLRVRLPNDYIVTTGPDINVQDTSEQQTVLTMSTQKHVDVSFTTAQKLLSLDDFSERILYPMMNNLAGGVAADIMSGVEGGICNIAANFDDAGVILTPNSGTYLDAGATLKENSAPLIGKKVINDPRTEARVVQSLSGLLNPGSAISDQYYEGVMYRALGALWFSDQTVIKHTTGSFSAGGTVNQAGQSGSSLVVNAITGTLKKGDIITVAGVNAVNRVTKQDSGTLRQFVVTADVPNGGTAISIYPAIIPPNLGNAVQYQTVAASPANGAAVALVTLASSVYRKNFMYVPQMVTMATGDLPLPEKGIVEGTRENYDQVSMRAITDYQIGTDQLITRLDVLYGYLFVRPEWGCIVADKV